jgi:uncharacterized protein involved in outer membrane biogenesis
MSFIKKHKILTGLLSFFLLVVLLVGGTFVYVEKYGLKNLINAQGSSKLGRTLFVGGDADIKWHGLTATVSIGKLSLANAEGSQDEDMLYIEKLDFDIRPLRLLIGQLVLPSVNMEKPKLILEKKENGENNWDLPAFSKGNAVTETVVPDDRHDFPLIETLSIRQGQVIYRDDKKKLNLDLMIDSASGSGGDDEKGLSLKGEGKLQEKTFKLIASGGSLDTLRYSSKDYPLDIEITMGATRVKFAGSLREPVKMTGIDAVLELEGKSLADLYDLTGIPLPITPAYKLGGKLKKSGDLWSYEDFTGLVGQSDLNGNLAYDTSGERGFVKATLTSKLLDAEDLGGFIGLSDKKTKTEAADRILPDVPINLDRLRAADMDVSLKAQKVNAPGWPVEGLDVRFVLKDGILTIEPLNLSFARGQVSGKLVLDGSKDMPDVTADITMKKLSLKSFFTDTRFEALTKGLFGGKIQVQGQGKSLADVLASSDGRITAIMSGGQISLLIIEASGLDIAESTALLLDHDKTTHIRCGVGDFKVTDGILDSETFILDTNDTNVQGKAKINLRDETINAQIKAHPKDPSLLAARTPITISGKLKKPSIGLSPGELGGRGAIAAILGTVLTPVAAIIPFIELGMGEDSDCKGLIAQAQKPAATN